MVAEQALARERKKKLKLTARSCVLKWFSRSLQGGSQPGGKARALHTGVASRKSPLLAPGSNEADRCAGSHAGERQQQASSLFLKVC